MNRFFSISEGSITKRGTITGSSRIVNSLSNGEASVIKSQVTQISDNLYVRQDLIAKRTPKKRDYAPDLAELVRRGMSVEEASSRLGVSKSYTHKLLKNR